MFFGDNEDSLDTPTPNEFKIKQAFVAENFRDNCKMDYIANPIVANDCR